jgi:hypothetical protein
MKIKGILILCLSLAFANMQGQDQIHLLDKTIIASKVLKISKTTIEYKKYNNINGPTYNVSPLEVWYIQYENSSIDSFSKLETAKQNIPNEKPIFKKYNNIISLHPANITGNFNNNINTYYAAISYERLISKGNIGCKGIFRASNTNGVFAGGLQCKWYPTGQGLAKYYLGLGSEIFAFQNNAYYSAELNWSSVYFTNGVSINVTNRFNISAEANIGDTFTGTNDQALFYLIGIGFGVRF